MNTENITSVVEFDTDISTAERPAPLPEGVYAATIVGAEVKVSQKGNRYASLQVKIAAEEYPVDFVEGNKEGTTLRYMRLGLSNDTRAKYALKMFCKKIGAPMSNRIDVQEWIGSPCKVEVKHEIYEGEPMANITKFVD